MKQTGRPAAPTPKNDPQNRREKPPEITVGGSGLNEADYSFMLDGGGGYAVHVGCGGTSDAWAVSAKSGTVYGADVNFICNDVPWWLQWAGDWAFKRAGLGLIGIGDLPAYETCTVT